MSNQLQYALLNKSNETLNELELNLEKRLQELHPKKIDLSLKRINKLLIKLNNPHKKINNVIHIAGTNGKGSVLAFLKSFLKSGNYSVNSYSSPHLINFNERIDLNGKNISNKYLEKILKLCEKKNNNNPITFFEITTVAAFIAFKENPADYTILETGLGGRLDATNVMRNPIVSIINEISIDHTNFLGSNIKKIALEKAGIIKSNYPVVIGAQPDLAKNIIKKTAEKLRSKTFLYGNDWFIKKNKSNKIVFINDIKSKNKEIFPLPNLKGDHQIINAGIAIKVLKLINKLKNKNKLIKKGLIKVRWPGRLQKIKIKKINFVERPLNKGWELWFDGGHNKSASNVIAKTFKSWKKKDLYLIFGMLDSKDPKEFLNSFKKITKKLITVPIKSDSPYYSNKKLYEIARLKEFNVETASSIKNALNKIFLKEKPSRILICGSFYMYKELAGLLKK